MNINKYSNPSIVMKKAKELHLNPIQLSSRKDKKFMVLDPNTNKMVHFGQMVMKTTPNITMKNAVSYLEREITNGKMLKNILPLGCRIIFYGNLLYKMN